VGSQTHFHVFSRMILTSSKKYKLLRGKSGLSGSLSRVFTYDPGLVQELQTTNYKLQAQTLVFKVRGCSL